MAEKTPAAVPPEPSDVRFSIRTLLILTIPVALIAALLGAYYRRIPADRQTHVAAVWGVGLICVVAWLGYYARKRFRLEWDAGAKLIELLPSGTYLPRVGSWGTYVAGTFLVVVGLLYLVLLTDDLGSKKSFWLEVWRIIFYVLFMAAITAQGVAYIWWKRTIQLRAHGVLHGLRLLPWDSVTNCRWESPPNDVVHLEGVDRNHLDVRLAMQVPSDYRQAVEIVLSEKLSESINRPTTPAGAQTPELIRPFPLTSVREKAARGCFFVLAFFAAGVLLSSAFYRGGMREFTIGCLAGFLLMCAVEGFQARGASRAGRPLVRLAVGIDWPVLLAWMLYAGFALWLGSFLSTVHGWLAGILGFAFGAALIIPTRALWHRHLDLCENGIVVAQWLYWPWQRIHVTWTKRNDGRVGFRRGWRRMIAIVPTGNKETVEAILRERLPASKFTLGD